MLRLVNPHPIPHLIQAVLNPHHLITMYNTSYNNDLQRPKKEHAPKGHATCAVLEVPLGVEIAQQERDAGADFIDHGRDGCVPGFDLLLGIGDGQGRGHSSGAESGFAIEEIEVEKDARRAVGVPHASDPDVLVDVDDFGLGGRVVN